MKSLLKTFEFTGQHESDLALSDEQILCHESTVVVRSRLADDTTHAARG